MDTSRRQFLARTTVGAAVIAGGSFAAGPAAALISRPAGTTTRTTALTNVTVIDVATGRRNGQQTVLIGDDRIVAVGRNLPVPRGTTTIDLTGRFVIPGLADMHVHALSTDEVDPPLHLANGVTTVRIMSGDPQTYDWRDRIDAGTLLGPRMVVASQIIDGDPTLWDPDLMSVLVVRDEATARAAVRQVKAEGADFVKVYSRLSPTAYRAILDEARRQGVTVAGHAPDQVSIPAVADAGQRSIEHLHAVALSVSGQEAEVRRQLRAISLRTGDYNGWFRQLHPIEWLTANTFSSERAADVLGRLRHRNTRVTPTLAMHRVLDMPDHTAPDPATLKYLSEDTLGVFEYVLENLYKANRPAEEIARQRQMWDYRQRFVRELLAHDVPILAGTDTGTPYSVPGFALHDELELLVGAGATPQQALRAATVEPARFFGLGEVLGSVEPGRIADLVVLDADPLDDIRNTRRIHSVVTRGRLISPQARRRMLADVEAAVKKPASGAAITSGGCCGMGV
ncbi:amidohydrolase family protein [Streptomyces sp. NPDC060223]|uniref:amidohydrolase family protein n=1 Tax=unclassified Streptomyces TaxID=2593676 RepID=UPI00364446C1